MEHYRSDANQTSLKTHGFDDPSSSNPALPPPAKINGGGDPPTLTPHLHATFVFTEIRRYFLRSDDGNVTLLGLHGVEYPYRPEICLGTVGLFRDYPRAIWDRVAGFLTRHESPEWFDKICEVLSQEIEKLPADCGTRLFEFFLSRKNDIFWDEAEYLEMVTALSEAEARQSNYGMVPAAENAIGELLAKVEIRDVEEEAAACVICLEDLPSAAEAAEMPCRHRFHRGCIVDWLKQSHYCPICRFEMPTEQKTAEFEIEIFDFPIEDDAVPTEC